MRYEQADINVPSSTFTGGGSQAVVSQATSAIGDLISRLDSFKAQSFKTAGAAAEQEATNQAALDIVARKAKVDKIRQSGKSYEEQQTEIDSLLEGTVRDDMTIYSQAYNTAADAAYSSQVTLDAKAGADLAAAQANGDSAAFLQMYQTFERETVSAAPSKNHAILAKRAFLQYGAEAYKTLATAEYKKQVELDKSTYTTTLDTIKNDVKLAKMNGDDVTASTLLLKARAMANDAIKKGYTTEDLFQAYVSTAEREIAVDMVKSGFIKANVAGAGFKFIESVYQNKNLQAKLLPKEFSELIEYMNTGVANRNKAEEDAIKKFETTKKQGQYKTEQELLMLQHNGELSQDWLDTKHQQGLITDENWKKYSGRVGKTTEDILGNEDLTNTISYGIEYYDSDDIMNAVGLSSEQRGKLLTERKKYETEIQDEWAKSIQGKEAIRRIKDNFPKASTLLGSSFDLNDAKEMDKMYQMFYDEMLSTPPEQRERKALPLAMAVIDTYKEKELEKKTIEKQQLDETTKAKKLKEEQEIEKSVQNYREKATEQQLKYYEEGVVLFRNTYGNTGIINFGNNIKEVQW